MKAVFFHYRKFEDFNELDHYSILFFFSTVDIMMTDMDMGMGMGMMITDMDTIVMGMDMMDTTM